MGFMDFAKKALDPGGIFTGDGFLAPAKPQSPKHFSDTADYNAGAFDAKNYGYDENKARMQQEALARAQMANPTMQAAQGAQAAQINMDPQAQFRAQQMGLAGTLQNRINGNAPSVAELQLKQGAQQAMKQQLAMSKGAFGMNPGAARRAAMQGQADIMGQQNMAAAQLRAQEQQAAEGAMGQLLAAGRGQDASLATAQAQMHQQANIQGADFQQQANQANLQAGLQAQGQKDQMAQYYNQGLLGLDQNAQNAAIAQQQMLSSENAQLEAARLGQIAQYNQQRQNLMGGALTTFGSLSDRRAKTDIDEKAGGKDIDAFLDHLKPAKYRYKKEEHGEGDQWSVMAQQLEMSKVGKKMVQRRPDGLREVNYLAGLPAMLASQARLNERLKKIEKRAA